MNSSVRYLWMATLASLVACGGDTSLRDAQPMQIKVLSNRADLVSGGNAYVEIVLPSGATAAGLRVEVEDRDVTGAFGTRADNRVTGVITGLREGKNVVTAEINDDVGARITIVNHRIGGPIFSGPQVTPWVCATPAALPASTSTPPTNVSGLPTAATDRQCNTATAYKFFYRTTEQCSQPSRGASNAAPCFKQFDPKTEMPQDIAETTTDRGLKVPYIVRVERGVVNRGIYDVAVLFDPTTPWQYPYAAQPTWNRKLLWSFGGSTGTPYRQHPPNSTWQIDYALSRGYMVGVSSLTDQALNSNHVVAAETLMMLKEHIVENYGEIRYTIGTGCSGGSIMQLQITSLYPGLLNGIQPSCTYPDSYSTSIEVTDCVLLGNYFKSTEFEGLTSGLNPEQLAAKKAAIAGHLNDKACPAWVNSFGNSNTPGVYTNSRGQRVNNCQLLDSQVYDAKYNPEGVRCSIPEYAMAIWGPSSADERVARRTSDNVGIEYGLKALQNGQITPEEFVVLNQKIGGSDVDAVPSPARMVADAKALNIAYSAGIVGDARQWAKVPIIDLRGNDNSSIHMNWRTFAVRERLDRVNGTHANQVIWRFGPGLLPPPHVTVEALQIMDKWLANVEADQSGIPLDQKVVRAKPAEAFDFCYLGVDYSRKVTDPKTCDADPVLKYYASPRQIAGGPLAEDVLKCQLRPIRRSDYPPQLTVEQWERLKKVFPNGVCDWTKPGVGMRASTPWRTFEDEPGGEPLGAAPVSKPL